MCFFWLGPISTSDTPLVETYMNIYGLHKKADASMSTVAISKKKKKEARMIGSNLAKVKNSYKLQFREDILWTENWK